MQRGVGVGGLFPPVEWLCWNGDNTDASFGK